MAEKQFDKLQKQIYQQIRKQQSEISRTIDVTEHAKIVRAELKKRFPQIRFRVRTSRFAGGDAVTVYHLGNISKEQEEQIKEFVRKFDGFSSDLMDSRYNVGFLYNGERIAGASFCNYNYRWYK